MLLGLRNLLARIIHIAVLLDQLLFEFFDLALARQHAVQLVIRRVEQHAVRADQMAFWRDEPAARRQLRALRITLRHIRHGIHMRQPIAHGWLYLLIFALHIIEQGSGVRRADERSVIRRMARQSVGRRFARFPAYAKHRELGRRRIAPRRSIVQ